MTRGAAGVGFTVVNTAFLWAAIAIASVALWPVYGSPRFVVLVAVAAVVGSAIASAGARWRWNALMVGGVTTVSFLLVGVPLAVPAGARSGILPTLDGLRDLLTGVALGWKQLLTISLPVGDFQALLVPSLVLVLVVTVTSLSIALRARRGELAAIPPVLLYLVGILFGPTVAQWPVASSLSLLGVVLLWIVWRRWYRRREAMRVLAMRAVDGDGMQVDARTDSRFVGIRTLLASAVILAIAAGAAVGATRIAPPAAERQVLRSTIEQPFDPRAYPSPLATYRSYFRPPLADSVLLTVRGLPTDARVRVATLDTWDGVVYSVGSALVSSESGSFSRVPFRVDQSGVRGSAAEVDVTVGTWSPVWLPTVGQLERVRFAGEGSTALADEFYFNRVTGTGAVLGGLPPGATYSIQSVVPEQPTAGQLTALDPGGERVPPLTVLPDELSAALGEFTAGADTPGAKLVAMIEGLRSTGYVSHGLETDGAPSRSGHSADRITELLTAQRMIGDAEQYSATAALMARQLGFPARVVVGFEPAAAAGAVELRGSDLTAWIEVDTAQFGWVALDPNPEPRDIPDEQPQDPTTIARPQSVVPPPISDSVPFDRQSTPDTEQQDPSPQDPLLVLLLAVGRVVAWFALVVGIAVSPFLLVIAAKLRRRRLRRRAGTTSERIAGGWREFEDAAVDHGITPPAAATRTEVAEAVGGAQPLVLAAIADRANFAPAVPEEAEADMVWRAVDELTAGLGENRTRLERIRALVSVRSLGGYSVSNLFTRRGDDRW